MEIELLVVPDRPHEAPAADLITTAVADTGVQATVTRTVITSLDQARRRGFVGSPTILLNGSDPFADPAAPAGMACRLPHAGRTTRCPRAAGSAPSAQAGSGSRPVLTFPGGSGVLITLLTARPARGYDARRSD